MENKNFRFKKEFGQNFIFDTNFITSFVRKFDIPSDSNIVEIGAGMGTLTEVLAKNFKRVVSFEIDKTLTEKLRELESGYQNLTVVFGDILEQKLSDIERMFDGEKYFVVANLPYYITSQIIFKFLFESQKLDSMFVMVQREVGERYCAKSGTKEYGIPSVMLGTFAETKIVQQVSRKMFTPMPNVDSCIIRIKLDRNKFDIADQDKFHKFVSGCFAMKRKTLANNLKKMGYNEGQISSTLNALSLIPTIRPENISPEDYVTMFNLLCGEKHKDR